MYRPRRPSLSIDTKRQDGLDGYLSVSSTCTTQNGLIQGRQSTLSTTNVSRTSDSTTSNMSICSDNLEESYIANNDVFIKDRVAVNRDGVAIYNNPRKFTLRYEDLVLGEIIGRGCSSIVLHAQHLRTHLPLALKVINLFDQSKRRQLVNEIIALYDAECPSLVTFYGAFYREGSITIALEYMDGGSLANVLHQIGPIPEPILAAITFQILWGLAYMHHEKRVHRDLKPSNLLVSSTGAVKLTDFGVSAELLRTASMCGTFVGTLKYMSPERIANRPYSYASDLWSLGLILLESLTAQFPLRRDRDSWIDLAQSILDGEIPSAPSTTSPEFQEVVKSCLQRNPDNRPSANSLLCSPWMRRHNVHSLEIARNIVHNWIVSLPCNHK